MHWGVPSGPAARFRQPQEVLKPQGPGAFSDLRSASLALPRMQAYLNVPSLSPFSTSYRNARLSLFRSRFFLSWLPSKALRAGPQATLRTFLPLDASVPGPSVRVGEQLGARSQNILAPGISRSPAASPGCFGAWRISLSLRQLRPAACVSPSPWPTRCPKPRVTALLCASHLPPPPSPDRPTDPPTHPPVSATFPKNNSQEGLLPKSDSPSCVLRGPAPATPEPPRPRAPRHFPK